MSTTDTSEAGLEALIVRSLVEDAGYVAGTPQDYDRAYALDMAQLTAFLTATQPEVVEAIRLTQDTPRRNQFLHRLQGEIVKRGVIEVLRSGIKDGPVHVQLFYGSPSPGNATAAARFTQNIFSVTRQLRYSQDASRLALDLVIFVNGLPLITFELKNKLTKQTVGDAIAQYKRDRDPRELLFHFGRCLVHFAVDDQEAWMCPHLLGKDSWFLPFNQGWNDGAGNPPNPNGVKTDYLWRQILRKESLTDILENYAQVVGKKKRDQQQIFPRYHQLDAVRKLLDHTAGHGAGKRYLIQHSAGSGKSNSIAWLAHQLIGLGDVGAPVFDTVLVVTDRRNLDRQIRDTIRNFAQVSATVAPALTSADLRSHLASGKKLIITTVQKFPVIVEEIGNAHRGSKFAIIIDEAHSSQGGRTAAQMNMVLSPSGEEVEETPEDQINRLMESRKMLGNASYFAFTATPKAKTLELFGAPVTLGGQTQFRPFHHYSMKQAIQEGFIRDVLASYTPVDNYYRLVSKVEDDPEYDVSKARRKLRHYVESHDHAIHIKAEIMVDHFHDQVMGARRKVGGQARAMVVCNGVKRAIQYYHAISAYLAARKSPHKAIVAFSGEHEDNGHMVTESSLNGFPENQTPEKFREDPYRFLIVADKYQTGYDEPLLHTMYVDKPLEGIRAVQTLSRLNRAHPQKTDTFVLDFYNNVDTIRDSFAAYYRTTILSDATDPNKLHDLKADLDGHQVYIWDEVEELVRLFLDGADRDRLEPLLETCVARYVTDLEEDSQVDFKGKAKAFVRTYQFLASVLPYTQAEWEKLSIFLNFLIAKLPAPVEEDLSQGILQAIDMDSYRAEVQAAIQVQLPDADAELEPIPTEGGGGHHEPELERLSQILKMFNEQFSDIDWEDADRVREALEELPAKVAANRAYQNAMRNSDQTAARMEHDKALQGEMLGLMKDFTELFKQYSDNPAFKRALQDAIFTETYRRQAA